MGGLSREPHEHWGLAVTLWNGAAYLMNTPDLRSVVSKWLDPTLDYDLHLGVGARIVQVNGATSVMGIIDVLERNPRALSITWVGAEVNDITLLLARAQEDGYAHRVYLGPQAQQDPTGTGATAERAQPTAGGGTGGTAPDTLRDASVEGCREVIPRRKDVYTPWGFRCVSLGEPGKNPEITAIELKGVMGMTNALREAVGSPDVARVGDIIMAVNEVTDTTAMKAELVKPG